MKMLQNQLSPSCSVHVKLPKLAAGEQEPLQAVADQFQLQVIQFQKLKKKFHTKKIPPMQVRGSAGEHSEAKGGLYDVSNRERMRLTEFEVNLNIEPSLKFEYQS